MERGVPAPKSADRMIAPESKAFGNGRHSSVSIYNARSIRLMLLRSAGFRQACFVLVAFSGMAQAGEWRDSELELARKISSATGPGVISLELRNRSSLLPTEVEEIRRGFVELLATAGVRVWQKEQSSSEVVLTLAEDLQQYVWVAEIRQSVGDRRVLMVAAPRPRSPTAGPTSNPVSLHPTRLVLRPDPILDAAFLDQNPAILAVLTQSAATLYQSNEGHWTETSSLAIHATRPFPRDLRGRLIPRHDRLFDAYLPGVICRATASAPLALNCVESDDPWPLASGVAGLSAFFAPTRNFFTGALVPGIGDQRSAPTFYTAAAVARERYTLWLFRATDGELHLLDGMSHQIANGVHWGSEIAGVHAPCRPRSEVLATSSTGDGRDAIQAFEFPDREPVAVSQKLEFDGKVTALWTEESGENAMALVQQSATGDYAAVLINLDCSR
jgi:hypothetical protein